MPMCVGHDLHRTIGWMEPFGIYIEPKLARLMGRKVIQSSQEETRLVQTAHNHYICNRYNNAFEPHQEKFLELIGRQLSDDYMRLEAGCVAAYDKGIATRCFPDLFAQIDDAGLISIDYILSHFLYLGQGIFK